MGVPNLYEPVAIVLPSGTEITQLENVDPENNFADLTKFSAGSAFPKFTGSHSAMPAVRTATTQIKDLLDEIDVEGVAADLSGDNLDVEYRRALNRGSRYGDAAEEHLRCRMTSNAFLTWESLRAEQDQDASIDFTITPVWDETNDPLIWASGSGVTVSATDAVGQLYTLGPIIINSTTLDGVSSVDWQNNITRKDIKSDGSHFLKFSSVDRVSPVVTVDISDKGIMQDYGSGGTAITSFTFYLRKKLASNYNVPNATAQHIRFTATAGTIKPLSSQGRFALHLQNFAINTAVAIS